MAGNAAGMFVVSRRWRLEGAVARRVGPSRCFGCLRFSESCGIAVASVTAIVAQYYGKAKAVSRLCQKRQNKKAQNPRVKKLNQLPGARGATASRPRGPSQSRQRRVPAPAQNLDLCCPVERQTLVVRRESALIKLTTAAVGRVDAARDGKREKAASREPRQPMHKTKGTARPQRPKPPKKAAARRSAPQGGGPLAVGQRVRVVRDGKVCDGDVSFLSPLRDTCTITYVDTTVETFVSVKRLRSASRDGGFAVLAAPPTDAAPAPKSHKSLVRFKRGDRFEVRRGKTWAKRTVRSCEATGPGTADLTLADPWGNEEFHQLDASEGLDDVIRWEKRPRGASLGVSKSTTVASFSSKSFAWVRIDTTTSLLRSFCCLRCSSDCLTN